jgi:hypothetical protein
VGSAGETILIGGPTVWDEDRPALCGIADEWARTDADYALRIDHLMNGGGLNGEVRLSAATVGNDAAVDKLTGGAGQDWFIAETRDKLTGRQSSEQVLYTDGAGVAPSQEPCESKERKPLVDWSGGSAKRATLWGDDFRGAKTKGRHGWKVDFVLDLGTADPNHDIEITLPLEPAHR